MNGYLKIKCIEVTKNLNQADELFKFITQADHYNERARLIQLYVHLGSLEELKKAVQHQFPDGTTILEDFSPEPEQQEQALYFVEQAQKAPKQREWGDL